MNIIDNVNLKEVFKEALSQTIANYTDNQKLEITHLILNICGQYRPYMLVTELGAEEISDEIFLSDIKRDFISNLLFNFCPRITFNNIKDIFQKIVITLSFSLTIGDTTILNDGPPKENKQNQYSKIPAEVNNRLPNYSDVSALLSNNKWLIMVLFIALYVNIEDFTIPQN